MNKASKSKNSLDDEVLEKVKDTKSTSPDDDPLLRHQDGKEDITFGSEGKRLAELRSKAVEHAATMPGDSSHPVGLSTAPPVSEGSNWVQMGPTAITNGQTYGGARVLVTGRVTSTVVDHTDSNTIYVGGAQGGVWKTIDAGKNWIATSDHSISLAIGALVMDPTNHLILYAGTGEGNFSGDSYYGNGILQTIDGGNSWTSHAQSTFAGARFCRLAVNPIRPSTIFAATTSGIFRSIDGGITWTVQTNGVPPLSPSIPGATDIVIDPSDPDSVYAAFWSGGIYKTTDANSTTPSWTQLTSGLPANGFTRIALSISKSSPQTIYALISGPPNPDPNLSYLVDKFSVTTNGGGSWSSIPLPGGAIGGQGFYNLVVECDPSTPDIVYLAGIELWKAIYNSVSGTWNISKIGGNIHPDTHALAFDPIDHQVIYCGNDGGIYKSVDGGITWNDVINEGLCITQFEFMEQHPGSDAVVLAGTQDNGTEQFRNSPVFYHSADGDGGFCLIDQSNQNNYIHTYYGLSPERSIQAGKFGSYVWIASGLSGAALFYPPLSADQSNSNNIAMGGTRIFIDNAQGTAGWGTTITLPGFDALPSHRISAINYTNSDLIYVGTNKGKVYRLVRNVGAWNATEISNSPLPSRFIWDVSPLPSDSNTIIVIMSGFGTGHVWRGAVPMSGATVWTDISGSGATGLPDIPINALAIEPSSPNTMYVGTDIGVFATTDAGTTWMNLSQGLPNVAIFDMRFHAPTRLLRVATHGRGMWERKLDTLAMTDVDIFVRDNLMDTGRFSPSPLFICAAFEDDLHGILLGDNLARWMCADIKIDALAGIPPAYQMDVSHVDYVAFEAKLEHRNPQRGRVNRLYIQVHNRGILPGNNVTVKILYTDASAGLPPLPPDFWTAFPSDSIDTTNWKPIGPAKVISALSNTEPAVLEWDWLIPTSAADHTCILAIVDCAADPIPSSNKVFNVDDLGVIEKRVGFKNLHVINAIPGAFYWTPFQFFGKENEQMRIRFSPLTARAWNVGIIFQKERKVFNIQGFVRKSPTKRMLLDLKKKLKEGIREYNISEIYMFADIERGGYLGMKIPKEGIRTMLLFMAPDQVTSGTISVIQEETKKNEAIGGSTFILQPKTK